VCAVASALFFCCGFPLRTADATITAPSRTRSSKIGFELFNSMAGKAYIAPAGATPKNTLTLLKVLR
jgi:hypothetical protein